MGCGGEDDPDAGGFEEAASFLFRSPGIQGDGGSSRLQRPHHARDAIRAGVKEQGCGAPCPEVRVCRRRAPGRGGQGPCPQKPPPPAQGAVGIFFDPKLLQKSPPPSRLPVESLIQKIKIKGTDPQILLPGKINATGLEFWILITGRRVRRPFQCSVSDAVRIRHAYR